MPSFLQSTYGYLPQTVVGEVVRGLAILEAEYGLDRNYLEVGGYSLIADTRDDLSRARDIFDDRKHYCEWSTKLSESFLFSDHLKTWFSLST